MFFIIKILLFNLLFGFLIFGTCYVYFSTKLPERTKFYLMSSTFFLFLTYLMMVYFLHTTPSNFKNLPVPSKVADSVLQFPSFRMELKLKQGKMLQLDDYLSDPPVVSAICAQDIQDVASMVHTVAVKERFLEFYLTYLDYERDYENKSPHVFQGLRNDLLTLRNPKKTLIVINGLPSKVIQSDFIGLLRLIHQDNPNMHFLIIENREEVCSDIKGKLTSKSVRD